MRKFLVLGLLLVLSAPQLANADDTGASGTPAPSTAPTLISKPSTNSQPSSSAKPSPSAKSSTVAKTVEGELTKIRALIERKDYTAARAALLIEVKDFPKDADINNLLGYTSRKLKLYSAAARYYDKALSIKPDHLGALEYQGELFVETKKLDSAKKNLAKLKELCGLSCEEYLDLKKAIGNK